jgi:hypothetical protein
MIELSPLPAVEVPEDLALSSQSVTDGLRPDSEVLTNLAQGPTFLVEPDGLLNLRQGAPGPIGCYEGSHFVTAQASLSLFLAISRDNGVRASG